MEPVSPLRLTGQPTNAVATTETGGGQSCHEPRPAAQAQGRGGSGPEVVPGVAVLLVAARTGPTSTPVPSGYSHAQLQADSQMTQMSVPGASGPMSSGAVVDDQLRRSQDPAYVAALEAHQREIERMLGGGTP